MPKDVNSKEADEQARVVEHLRAVLEADEIDEKDFHAREALQLLRIDEP